MLLTGVPISSAAPNSAGSPNQNWIVRDEANGQQQDGEVGGQNSSQSNKMLMEAGAGDDGNEMMNALKVALGNLI